MSRADAWLLHGTNLLVAASGLAYGWMRYLIPEDPEAYSSANHPLQPEVQALHILGAPLLLFALGLIWRTHVWRRFQGNYQAHRKTGVCLMLLLAPMIFSGYLLQVTSSEGWRLFWIWSHGISSCLWILAYVLHQIARGKPKHAEQVS